MSGLISLISSVLSKYKNMFLTLCIYVQNSIQNCLICSRISYWFCVWKYCSSIFITLYTRDESFSFNWDYYDINYCNDSIYYYIIYYIFSFTLINNYYPLPILQSLVAFYKSLHVNIIINYSIRHIYWIECNCILIHFHLVIVTLNNHDFLNRLIVRFKKEV